MGKLEQEGFSISHLPILFEIVGLLNERNAVKELQTPTHFLFFFASKDFIMIQLDLWAIITVIKIHQCGLTT